MNILLNGATGGTNFGDFLFAKEFQDSVSNQVGTDSVFWYEARYSLSDFYKKHLNYNKKYKLKDINALVCISGGYFCGNDQRLKDYIIRYLSYFHICLKCIIRGIPIAIIGVEVAKPKMKLMECIEKYILKRAKLVVVRNQESFRQLNEYGITSGYCTADTAHTIKSNTFRNCTISESIDNQNSKKIFFHVQLSCVAASKRLLPAFNDFLRHHPDYCVVIGTDQYIHSDVPLHEIANEIYCDNIIVNHYDNPIALCKVLSRMDFIITPKLHVGIVGATLSKSVVSFSEHSEKTSRFYHQLNEDGRSLPMTEYTNEKGLAIMEKYHDCPICVPQKIIDLANQNWEHLKVFLKNVQNGNEKNEY